jgi:hypothetical protein
VLSQNLWHDQCHRAEHSDNSDMEVKAVNGLLSPVPTPGPESHCHRGGGRGGRSPHGGVVPVDLADPRSFDTGQPWDFCRWLRDNDMGRTLCAFNQVLFAHRQVFSPKDQASLVMTQHGRLLGERPMSSTAEAETYDVDPGFADRTRLNQGLLTVALKPRYDFVVR